jgi:3-phytase
MKQIIYIVLITFISSCAGFRFSEGSAEKALKIKQTVVADVETDELADRDPSEDAADDPAIWVNKENKSKSTIFGTDKKGGLAVYNLEGKELAYYKIGRVNNVDIRQSVETSNGKIDFLGVSNRTTNCIDIYKIIEGEKIELIESQKVGFPEIYGFGLAKLGNRYFAVASGEEGHIEQWEINFDKKKLSLVKSFKLDTKTEGIVADDELGNLYIAEEETGIWKVKIDPESKSKSLVSSSLPKNNDAIQPDIEGVCLYKKSDGSGYLIASSQGNYSYSIFDRTGDNKYITSFRIVDAEFDGVEETDGIEVMNENFGEKYQDGIFVVQDGFNYNESGVKLSQNFKIVSWTKIQKMIK